MKNTPTDPRQGVAELLGKLSATGVDGKKILQQIEDGLTRFFRFRGCDDPEKLALESIASAAKNLKHSEFNDETSSVSFFYPFAKKRFERYMAERSARALDAAQTDGRFEIGSSTAEFSSRIERCLDALEPDERAILCRYYAPAGFEKDKIRDELADELTISRDALEAMILNLRGKIKRYLEQEPEKSDV